MSGDQQAVNTEILARLARIEVTVDEVKLLAEKTNGRVTALEGWREEHQPWSEQGRDLIQAQADAIAAFEVKLDRMAVEVIRSVSATLQAMVHEARDSAWKEDFRVMFREVAEKEREEQREQRKQDIKEALKWTQATVKFVLPVLQVAAIVISWWLAT